jgi:nitrogen fixation protein
MLTTKLRLTCHECRNELVKKGKKMAHFYVNQMPRKLRYILSALLFGIFTLEAHGVIGAQSNVDKADVRNVSPQNSDSALDKIAIWLEADRTQKKEDGIQVKVIFKNLSDSAIEIENPEYNGPRILLRDADGWLLQVPQLPLQTLRRKKMTPEEVDSWNPTIRLDPGKLHSLTLRVKTAASGRRDYNKPIAVDAKQSPPVWSQLDATNYSIAVIVRIFGVSGSSSSGRYRTLESEKLEVTLEK